MLLLLLLLFACEATPLPLPPAASNANSHRLSPPPRVDPCAGYRGDTASRFGEDATLLTTTVGSVGARSAGGLESEEAATEDSSSSEGSSGHSRAGGYGDDDVAKARFRHVQGLGLTTPAAFLAATASKKTRKLVWPSLSSAEAAADGPPTVVGVPVVCHAGEGGRYAIVWWEAGALCWCKARRFRGHKGEGGVGGGLRKKLGFGGGGGLKGEVGSPGSNDTGGGVTSVYIPR